MNKNLPAAGIEHLQGSRSVYCNSSCPPSQAEGLHRQNFDTYQLISRLCSAGHHSNQLEASRVLMQSWDQASCWIFSGSKCDPFFPRLDQSQTRIVFTLMLSTLGSVLEVHVLMPLAEFCILAKIFRLQERVHDCFLIPFHCFTSLFSDLGSSLCWFAHHNT